MVQWGPKEVIVKEKGCTQLQYCSNFWGTQYQPFVVSLKHLKELVSREATRVRVLTTDISAVVLPLTPPISPIQKWKKEIKREKGWLQLKKFK